MPDRTEDSSAVYIQHRIVDYYQGGIPIFGHKMTVWENIAQLKRKLAEPPYEFKFDPVLPDTFGPEWEYGRLAEGQVAEFFADPRGADQNIAVQSRKIDDTRLTSSHTVYRQHGFHLKAKFSKVKDGLTLISDWLNQKPPHLVMGTHCKPVIEALINHRHKVRKTEGGRLILDAVNEDWTKHWADSLRYYAIHATTMRMNRATNQKKYREVHRRTPSGARFTQFIEVRVNV